MALIIERQAAHQRQADALPYTPIRQHKTDGRGFIDRHR